LSKILDGVSGVDGDAGVVDEDIQMPEFSLHGLDGVMDGIGVCDVELEQRDRVVILYAFLREGGLEGI
jgi:hypothetical protein